MSLPRPRLSRSILPTAAAAVCLLFAAAAALASPASAPSSRPTLASAPTIAGNARLGAVLTVSHGDWHGSQPLSFRYQWLRCERGVCTRIAGATSKTHTVDTADVGQRLRVDVTAKNADGTAVARTAPTDVVTGDATAPVNTSPPAISGNLRAGQQLHVLPGTWSGTPPIAFSYLWQRCPGSATKDVAPLCADIAGANQPDYTTTPADVGQRLRVRVTAKNAAGAGAAFTAPSELVGPGSGGSGSAISIDQVSLPDRLVVDKVSFQPTRLVSRAPFTMRVRVADLKGFLVSGALVYVLGIPYDRLGSAPEAVSGADGYATLTLSPTARLPLVHGGALVLFVRVRKAGDNLLAGVSSRRLVQVRVGR